MKREDLFRAIGEVQEEQIREAETVKRLTKPWKRAAAAAACLALIVSVCAAGNLLNDEIRWRALIGSFKPLEEPEAGSGADSGGTGNADGSYYWTDGSGRPSPNLSQGVEIAELQWTGTVGTPEMDPAPSPGLQRVGEATAEELFENAAVIFRGTVQYLRYMQIESRDYTAFYTVATVEVTDCIRGGLSEGDIYSILYTGFPDSMPAISENLGYLKSGSDAIFMPLWANPEAGWVTEDGFFAYADIADMYFDEGLRLLFLDTGEGLAFERSVYPDIAEAETLDEVAAYIREMLDGREETGRPAVVADVEEPPAGGYVFVEGAETGPNGAKELPGGAFISEEDKEDAG